MRRIRINYSPDDPGASAPDPNAAPPAAAPEWIATLPDDLKADDTLKAIPDVATLATRFKGAIELPADDAPPEARAAALDALANRLGRPETADAYAFPEVKDRPYTEGDKAIQTEFRPVAHNLRLTQDQVNGVVAFNNEITQRVIAHQTKVAADTEAALRADLGDKFDEALELGNRALAQVLGTAKVDVDTFRKLQLSDGSFVGDSKLMNALFIGIGKLIGETKFTGGGGGGGAATTTPLAEQAYPSMNKKE